MAGLDERTRLPGRAGGGGGRHPASAFRFAGPDRLQGLHGPHAERLAPRIRQCATAWGLGVVWPARIDRINILQATFEAMCRAVRCLRHPPALLCIDGNHTLPSALLAAHWVRGHGAHAPLPRQQALVRGDARVPAISAASILAKTYRDALMAHLDRRWPGYGFAAHQRLRHQGASGGLAPRAPAPQHRLTFAGVLPAAPGPAQGSLL